MVRPESDVETVIEGLEKDVGESVIETEQLNENRIRVVCNKRIPSIFPEDVISYLTLVNWRIDRTMTESIDGEDFPAIEFIRGDELDRLVKRCQDDYQTLDFDYPFWQPFQQE